MSPPFMPLPNIDQDMSNLSLDFNDTSFRQVSSNDPVEDLYRLIEQIANMELRENIMQHTQLILRRQQQQITSLERLNRDNSASIADQQIKYEKAVREMQFFKKKYEKLSEVSKLKAQRRRSYSTDSGSTYDPRPLLPPPEQPPLPVQHRHSPIKNIPPQLEHQHHDKHEPVHDEPKRRGDTMSPRNGPIHPDASLYSNSSPPPSSPTLSHRQRQPSLVSQVMSIDGTMTSTTTSSGSYEAYSPYTSATLYSIEEPSEPMPVMPTQATPPNAPTVPPRRKKLSQSSNPPIQNVGQPVNPSPQYHQKRLESLSFGGSDGFWDTISQNPQDGAVERLISNFIRRGGSPNTARQNAGPNQSIREGFGLIHAAVLLQNAAVLDMLLQNGANPNANTLSTAEEDKLSPCYLAASVGWIDGLHMLAEARADMVNCRGFGNRQRTTLHGAVEKNHIQAAQVVTMYTEGVLTNIPDANGATPVHYASATGNQAILLYLLQECRAELIVYDVNYETPLHYAARRGKVEVMSMLIEQFHVDPNIYVPRKVGTPLDAAKTSGQKKAVEYLKSRGATNAKKLDKKREEELAKEKPAHLEATLLKNGLLADSF
ncbi:hypothetical protein INT44_008275 [Umbelopsis vinacea]|uniref:Uncharacterized protein n=1 Tax=Umbelopsis vinacea TaxID=44442 RepID=A0A8H7UH28_9FUNG|nr:hypothetical protein INT44_008275 [Umbelopsis vinacea]